MIAYEEFETKTGGCLDAVDITPEIEELVQSSRVTNGTALVFSPHTTCCIVVSSVPKATAERLAETMESLAPQDLYYAHDDFEIRTENLVEHEDESPNARSHILHVFAGRPSECIPVVDGHLALGDRRRVLFVELDSSRPRRYCVQVLGE